MTESQYEAYVDNLGSVTFLQNYFSIPIYQRLYVWGEEQVELLVEDVLNSFLSQKELYLGNILLKKSADNTYELIDGQQRFTTLWLLFNFIEAQIREARFCLHESKPRLQFSIRDDVAHFLNEIPSRLKEGKFPSAPESSPDMQRMVKALSIIKTKVSEQFNASDNQQKLEALHEFLLSHVHLIVTFVPNNTDLNKLFELINGRGVQLQQHEILKALILEKITDNRDFYGRVWDVCSDMNHYVHRNLKNALVKKDGEKQTRYTWEDYFNENLHSKSLDELEKLFSVKNTEQLSSDTSLAKVLSLADIDNSGANEQPVKQDKADDLEQSESVESIVSFSTLLLYALATFDSAFIANQKERLPEYIDKNLIKIFRFYFERNSQFSSENFMAHLFKLRVVFDENVIKFVEPKEDRFGLNRLPAIAKFQINESGKSASTSWDKQASDDCLTQLQAMLYHAFTRTTQYWLVPYLKNLLEPKSNNGAMQPLDLLMKIDHQLYASKDDGTVLQKAIDFRSDEFSEPCYRIGAVTDNYHVYGQYWFYKMDWVIYFLAKKSPELLNGVDVSNFVFTARNSVEHIYPQKDGSGIGWLHNFGNLVLISVGMNSTYSALPLNEKKEKHESFKKKYGRSETLKLDLLYKQLGSKTELGEAEVKEHQSICVELLQSYNKLIAS